MTLALWWIMPIVIGIVYLVIGWVITAHLVKQEAIETPATWWMMLLLWLPAGLITVLYQTLKFMWKLPASIAMKQINK